MPKDPVYTYSQANVVDGKFTYIGSGSKARHTVALVSWSDPDDFGRQKVEPVQLQEGIARYGVNQIEVTAFGCHSKSQAQRVGLHILYSENLETETAQCSTTPGARVCGSSRWWRYKRCQDLPLRSASSSLGSRSALPSRRRGSRFYYYYSQSQDRCTMNADYFHMMSDNRIFLSRLQVTQQTLITSTFPVGGVTIGPQNATIFIVDLTEVPLGFG